MKALMNSIQPRMDKKELEKKRAVSRDRHKYLTTTNLLNEGLGNKEISSRRGNGFRTPSIINVDNLQLKEG
jgi:hypothetical protein